LQYRNLGKTGLCVSRLCFGTLTMGPLQAKIPPEEGAELLAAAWDAGVNFWDTAEAYRNYAYLRLALKKIGKQPVIATKTYACTAREAKESLEKARRELDLDIIPVFMLHEQESALTLEGHRSALSYMCEARERGLVKAVGISCHTIAAVSAAVHFSEVEVIHPIINYRGIGIKDGSTAEMLAAIRAAFHKGLGIYAMKVLGGGHLNKEVGEAFSFALGLDCLHAIAVGMADRDELAVNLCYFEGITPPAAAASKLAGKKRLLRVEEWCSGCGTCTESCPQGALVLNKKYPHVIVDANRCILCGYCGSACPEMCLKIY